MGNNGMIDWKSIKKAADLPSIIPEGTMGGAKTPGVLAFYPNRIAKPKDTLPGVDFRQPAPRPFTPAANPVANMGSTQMTNGGRGFSHFFNMPDGRQVPYAFSYADPSNPGRFFTTMSKGYIRPMLYGGEASAREQQETQDAYAARWKRLFEMAPNDAARRNLETRRQAGQIPPIIMKGAMRGAPYDSLKLQDLWFGDPNETVQATVQPGEGRSMSFPAPRNIFLGTGDRDAPAAWREEWAHQASLTPSKRRSVVDGIFGGDDYLNAYKNGMKPQGAYELDPAELTRMVLLQKAAAARLGYPRFRNPDEWEKFSRRQTLPVNDVPRPEPNRMDNPYVGSSDRLDPSTSAGNLMKVYDRLKTLKDDKTLPENARDKYIQQYNQLREALQDAIDMASYGQTDQSTMNA